MFNWGHKFKRDKNVSLTIEYFAYFFLNKVPWGENRMLIVGKYPVRI